MKSNQLIIALFASLVFFGCNQDKIDQLESQNKELQLQSQVQDSILNDFVSTFNTFEENLDQIKERENLISVQSEDPELRKTNKDRILQDIQEINALLDQNRTLISELEAKVQSSEKNARRFRGTIATLRKQLEERDAEVLTMKEELLALNFTIEGLNAKVDTLRSTAAELTAVTETQTMRLAEQEEEISTKVQTIEEQTKELQKAFYVTGSAKELKAANVLESKRLNTEAKDGVFTQIDITQMKQIPINARKVKLVTPHPTDSYVLKEEGKEIASLEITNPDRFWKTSRYLVVVTN